MELKKIYSGFIDLSNFINQNKISFQLAWKIDDLMGLMRKHVTRYNIERDSLIKELGELKEGSENEYTFTPEKLKEYNEKSEQLANTEIEFEFEKIPYELFSKEENLKVGEGVNMYVLKQFIK